MARRSASCVAASWLARSKACSACSRASLAAASLVSASCRRPDSAASRSARFFSSAASASKASRASRRRLCSRLISSSRRVLSVSRRFFSACSRSASASICSRATCRRCKAAPASASLMRKGSSASWARVWLAEAAAAARAVSSSKEKISLRSCSMAFRASVASCQRI